MEEEGKFLDGGGFLRKQNNEMKNQTEKYLKQPDIRIAGRAQIMKNYCASMFR